MHDGNGRRTRSLKQEMRGFAKEKNGQVVLEAALAVAKKLNLEKDEAKSLITNAALQSLIKPVVVSMYDDLPESTIEMLAQGNYTEYIKVSGSTSDAPFNPRAVRYDPVALLAVLFPIVQPILERNPTNIAFAASGLAFGLAVLRDQLKKEVTGVDAEIILIFKKAIAFASSSTLAKAALLNEVNNERNIRGVAALSATDFDGSLQRLLTYKFIDCDSGQDSITLNS